MAKQNITDRVKTYADACAVLGIKETLPDVGGLRPKDRPSVTAYYKLIVIAQALNEGWEPDWTNEDQPKWFPWFYFDREKNKTAGFAYADTFNAPTDTNAHFGSRLCFKTEALCAYAARQFEPLYEAWILYPNDVNPASDDTTRRDQEGAEKVGASEAPKDTAALIEKIVLEKLQSGNFSVIVSAERVQDTPEETTKEEIQEYCFNALSTKTKNILKGVGISTPQQLTSRYDRAEFMRLRNAGKQTIWEIEYFLRLTLNN